ncbi:MAG: phosphoketolase, partial [Cyanobacteria bacterium J06648_11]
RNKGVVITASKSPLPIRTTFEQTRQALRDGAIALHETEGAKKVVFAVIGDMTLIPVLAAVELLQQEGIGARVVSVVNPRRLYRSSDVAWETCSEPDGNFLDDAKFAELFGGDALLGVTGGASGMLEPIMLRSAIARDTFAWKRGETASSAGQIMDFNGLSATNLAQRARELMG